MAFQLTPNVEVRRDRDGRVRQLSHPAQPYHPSPFERAAAGLSDTLTPRALAEQYIREVSGILELPPSATENFAADVTASPSAAPEDLRFKEEKSVAGAATVSYNQTVFGLPIWDAGVSVRVNTSPMQVTGSHNAVHYDVEVERPPADAPYLPQRMDRGRLAEVLHLDAGSAPSVTATRQVIYRYEPENASIPRSPRTPRLTISPGLPARTKGHFRRCRCLHCAASIVPGHHYVVTEVLFSLAYADWGLLNWRAFVEPATGSVLYLRALVSCARGPSSSSDPVTVTGVVHSAAESPVCSIPSAPRFR